jgi:mannose/cellobiose epimerase-like protein (N-acyl-D-glucosamine 2-epimerase family)
MSQIPFDAVRAWVFQDALPFWAAHGIDRAHGGFLEEVGLDGAPTACGFKRVRVICRQTYAFAHAAHLGWAEGDALSRMGVDYLKAHAALPDGGWAKTLSREGAIIDATPDLYDLSFVMFAMAWRYRISGDADALQITHATLDYIQAHMRGPIAAFWSKLPAGAPRLQNPHMHLTEACIAAFEATNEQRFLDQAAELVTLLRTRLFDGVTLGERFDEDWRRLPGEEGAIVEPGHHFEWAWILAQYQRLTGVDVSTQALALAEFAEQRGVDSVSGAVFDSVRDDGAPIAKSSRAWTNTERIKAWLGVYELTGRDPTAELKSALWLLFDRYFAVAKPGLWIDQFDADGEPMSKAAPAGIVYHLLLAFSEVLRLESELKAQKRTGHAP